MIKIGKRDKSKALNQKDSKGVSLTAKSLFLASFIFLFIFISFNYVSAVPPVTTVSQFPEGYVIVENPHQYLEQNQDYQYNFFVYNSSTGILLDNSSLTCNFFLANKTGEIIFNGNPKYFSDGHWGIDILGGNFSDIGTHPYGVSCQDGAGGALAGDFEVTNSGFSTSIETMSENKKAIVLSILTLIAIILFITYLYNRGEYYLPMISGILFLLSGILAFNTLEGILGTIMKDVVGVILIGLGLLSLTEVIWRYFPNDREY